MALKAPHHTQVKLAAKCGLTIAVETLSGGEVYVLRMADGSIRTSGSDLKALLADATGQNIGKAPRKAKAPKKARKAAKAKRKARSEDGDEDGEDGDDEEDTSRSIIKAKYKELYRPHHNSCGDDMADALRDATYDDEEEAISISKLSAVASANGISLAKYKGRNNGWQGRMRMTVGNILRGLLRKGTDVQIGSQKFKALPEAKAKVKAAK